MNPNFLIIIPTYKREELIKEAVASIVAQDYPHWRVIISDSGSTLTQSGVQDWFPAHSNKISLIQYGGELGIYEHWERILQLAKNEPEDYFLLLGDDDALCSDCLSEVSRVGGGDVIACAVANFFEDKKTVVCYANGWDRLQYRVEFDNILADCIEKHGCSVFRENKRIRLPSPFPSFETHVSGYFISLKILRLVLVRHSSLWVDPFSDVGLGLAVYYAGFINILLKPLVVIRRHSQNGGMVFIEKDRMRLLERHKVTFSPALPRVVCFNLLSMISYLNLLEKINGTYCIKPRAWFYFICVRQVLGDPIFSKATAMDLMKLSLFSAKSYGIWLGLWADIYKYVRRRMVLRRRHLGFFSFEASSMREALLALNQGRE